MSGVEEGAPIQLAEMGSFHVGGRTVQITGKPIREVQFWPGDMPIKVDPNGTHQVEQMYVQYFIPAKPRGACPLLLWHGGGLTGVTWETTPDGREGWVNWFLRQGWAVYNSDAVERGRSGWAMFPDIFAGEPVFLPNANPYERHRIGAGPGSYDDDPAKRRVWAGNLFPTEAYEAFSRQFAPRFLSTDAAVVAAYTALLDKLDPAVVIAHSQGGQFAIRAAQARPHKVRALVLVETAGAPPPETAAVLRDVPILAVYGDFIDKDPRWPRIRTIGEAFLAAHTAAGGVTTILDLPARGIPGNSHMLMMDRNNGEVAVLVNDWLASIGLYS